MTKKHFERLAEQISKALANPNHYYKHGAETDYHNGVGSAAVAISHALKESNPRFDQDRFLKACGIDSK